MSHSELNHADSNHAELNHSDMSRSELVSLVGLEPLHQANIELLSEFPRIFSPAHFRLGRDPAGSGGLLVQGPLAAGDPAIWATVLRSLCQEIQLTVARVNTLRPQLQFEACIEEVARHRLAAPELPPGPLESDPAAAATPRWRPPLIRWRPAWRGPIAQHNDVIESAIKAIDLVASMAGRIMEQTMPAARGPGAAPFTHKYTVRSSKQLGSAYANFPVEPGS